MARAEHRGERSSVLVFLGHGQDDEGWEERLRRGEVQNPGPYGYAFARDRVDVAYARTRPEGRAFGVGRAGLKLALGFDLVHAWYNRQAIRAADVVWTHTEKEHLAVSVLKLVGSVPREKPVVAQSVWLWGWMPEAGRVRRAVTLSLLRLNQVHTVLAEDGARIGTEILGETVHVVPYGVTPPPFVEPGAPRARPVVIAPGNDRDRDWETLGRAAALCPELDFVVLSRRAAAQHLAKLPNVQVRQAADEREMAREYAECDVVVVPVKPNPHASGATTVLQAISTGRPTVVTRVGGIDLYGGETAFYCEQGEAASLAAALREALRRGDAEHCRRGREDMLARGLTEEDYAFRHVLLTEDLLAERPVRSAVSADTRPVPA